MGLAELGLVFHGGVLAMTTHGMTHPLDSPPRDRRSSDVDHRRLFGSALVKCELLEEFEEGRRGVKGGVKRGEGRGEEVGV